MKNLKFTVILLVFVLVSCSKLGQLSISSTNFEDVIQLTQNLTFSLNKEVGEQKNFDQWIDEEYIEFSPKVAGKFKWSDKSELIFSPEKSFAPATEYKAILKKAILGKSKYSVSTDVLKFHTPFPELVSSTAYWSKQKGDAEVRSKIKLTFNYAVNPTEIGKNLIVKNGDKNLTFQVSKSGDEEAIVVNINEKVEEDDELKINVKSGTEIVKYKLKEELSQVAVAPSKELVINEIETSFDDNKGVIKVLTNIEIKPENLEKFVNVIKKTDGEDKKIDLKFEIMDNGFMILGDFQPEGFYDLTIKSGLESTIGTKLSSDFTKEIGFGELPPSLGFVNKKAIYLSSKGNKNIGISIVNIPKVNVKVSKVYENNILQFINQNRYSDNYEEDEEGNLGNSYSYGEDYNASFSDVLMDKKMETKNLPKSGGVSVLNMNLPNQNSLKGIYLVSVRSDDEYYQNDTRLVAISDIGLIAKHGVNEIFVFTNSIQTTSELSDVEISLISTNNQVITTKKTDKSGVVVFDNLKETLGNFKVAMITARQSEDFNYLLYTGTEVETSRYEVEGKRDNATGFDAFIYGERNIYRPGETLHFVSVIRSENWSNASDVPVKTRLLMPNGKQYFSAQKITNAQGSVEITIPTEKSMVTGSYIFEVLNGNDALLSSQVVNIEEFMPDRIKVDVKTDKEFYRSGENISLSATAMNMFGPPASDRNYEMEMKLSRIRFSSKKYKEFDFDIEKTANFESIVREGKTNDKGMAEENFAVQPEFQDMGLLEAKCYVTVFDESSRPVNRLKKLNIYTQPLFYGIKMAETYVSTNAPVKFDLLALNKDEVPTNTTAVVEIVQYIYQTVVEKSDEAYKYVTKKETKIISKKSVLFKGGMASYFYTPVNSGEYEIRVYRDGASGWSASQFYAYKYGNTESTAFAVNNEGNVDISFDKETYKVGENAKVLFKTPFVGKMLITIERNKILEYRYVDTDKKSAEITLDLGKQNLPNIYVSATLFRPMSADNSLPLTVAHGYASVAVEEPSSKINVDILVSEKSRSNTKQKVTVKTGKANAEVTVAVVDEGILQVKNFKTPDIFNHFYQKRALEIASYDVYPYLFPEISLANTSSVGGDGYDLEKRINPLSNGRVELVAIWSGILKTNGSGEATFEFNIPQFSGDLRVMAVAYKDQAFGSNNKNMLVADPLVISTSMPRFLSPNDELTLPVTLTNTTKQNATVSVQAVLTGGIAIDGVNSQTIQIPAEKEARVQFSMKAAAIGEGTVSILANGLGEKFTNKTTISIRPASSLIKVSQSGLLTSEKTENLKLSEDFIDKTTSHRLLLSRSPLVKFANHFTDLLEYPYGCVEQTTSKAFPQLYFADLTKQFQQKLNTTTANSNVQAGINRLPTMQTSEGGLSMWPGSNEPFWWGTAYATHFLIEAQKAGYEVDKNFVQKLVNYISSQVSTTKNEEVVTYLSGQNRKSKSVIKQEVIYSLYVLALNGTPNRSLMNFYKQKQDKLLISERYLLAAAFASIGDAANFQSILPKNFSEDNIVDYYGDCLNSPIRNLSISLNALIDSDPKNLQIPSLARQLSVSLEASPYLNTQEQSFAFLALGKFAKSLPAGNMSASVTSNGKILGNFDGKNLSIKNNLVDNISISTKGKGSVYYFLESEGLSKTGKIVEEDKLLQVRREFFTRDGQQISNKTFKQNQLIVVKITLNSANNVPIKNVVITDILPAGLEIENPRIAPERELIWAKDQSQPEHFDIRDDRINYFVNAGGTKTFYYLARAVSKGKFVLGPVSADAMYNANYRSYNGAGVISVQ